MRAAMGEAMRIGELAARVGLTVRTLHHWDDLGLLRPSQRTSSGHRLYDARDLARLQRILSLRQLGLSLAEIGAWLERPEKSLADDLELHVGRLGREIEALDRLRGRLTAIARHLRTTGMPSVEALLDCLETTMNVEKHFTPEQLHQIEQRGRELGPEAIAQTETDWTALIAEVQAAIDRGDDPGSPTAQRLAARWQELVARFTGGDPGIAKATGKAWKHDGDQIRRQFGGPTPEMFAFIQKATAAR